MANRGGHTSQPESTFNDVQREYYSSDGSGARKRKPGERGRTQHHKILHRKSGDPKVKLEWNKFHQVVGDNAITFAETIGIKIRFDRKFNWRLTWPKIPKESKEWLWESLEDVWDFTVTTEEEEEYEMKATDILEARKTQVLKHAGKIFRCTKANWKAYHYKPHTTHEARLDDVPDGLHEADWKDLVLFWDSPDSVEDSENHKRIRESQKIKHTSGRTSFATRRHKIFNKGEQESLDGEFFVITHCNKETQQPLEEWSNKIIEDMQEKAGTDSDGNQNPLTTEVYEAVMPPMHRGHALGYGHGVTRSSLSARRSSGHSSTRLESLQIQMNNMKENFEQQLEAQKQKFEAQKEECRKEFEEELERRLQIQKEQSRVEYELNLDWCLQVQKSELLNAQNAMKLGFDNEIKRIYDLIRRQ